MIWRLVCSEKGRGSRSRSMSLISLSIRLPLRRLQAWQQATRFSQVELPPRERGMTWSRVSSLGGNEYAAILAVIAIAEQDVFAREGTGLVRDATVLKQPNHGRHRYDAALCVQSESVFLFSAGNTLKHQHERSPRSTNINGLVRRVEHEYRQLQHVARSARRSRAWIFAAVAVALAMDRCLRA